MKSFTAIALLGLVASAQDMFELINGDSRIHAESDAKPMLLPISQNITNNKFGCVVEESIYADQYTEKVI